MPDDAAVGQAGTAVHQDEGAGCQVWGDTRWELQGRCGTQAAQHMPCTATPHSNTAAVTNALWIKRCRCRAGCLQGHGQAPCDSHAAQLL
jgi:hypothetical protein